MPALSIHSAKGGLPAGVRLFADRTEQKKGTAGASAAVPFSLL